MKTEEAIKSRRSVRRYAPKKVKEELVYEILDIARYAPSSGNIQNWEVIFVKDRGIREKIAGLCSEQSWMKTAPVHLVICNDTDKIGRLYGKKGKIRYSRQNCSYFTQNILLAAHEKKLGACIVGAYDENALRSLLGIPENVFPECVVTLGYPEGMQVKGTKRNDVGYFLYFNGYGNKVTKNTELFPLHLNKKVGKLKDKLFKK